MPTLKLECQVCNWTSPKLTIPQNIIDIQKAHKQLTTKAHKCKIKEVK